MRSGILLSFLCLYVATVVCDMPCPWTRELSVQKPLLNGPDVYLLQKLLVRVVSSTPSSQEYDFNTESAINKFQSMNNLNVSGIFDSETATTLLAVASDDGYRDNGIVPPGYLYKVFVPVYRNRSIETAATLYAANGTVLHVFQVRSHGQDDASGNAYNQFCGSGSTPTGLSTFDLNSPEDDPVSYGPYPVNRAVDGLEGNALGIISNIRDGILLHTGEWPNWTPSQPMPDSHGCIHAHPADIEYIWNVLVSMGVNVRNNTGGKLPYPYVAQGILSVQQLD